MVKCGSNRAYAEFCVKDFSMFVVIMVLTTEVRIAKFAVINMIFPFSSVLRDFLHGRDDFVRTIRYGTYDCPANCYCGPNQSIVKKQTEIGRAQ